MLRLSSQPIVFVIGCRLIEITVCGGVRAQRIRLEVELPDEAGAWNGAIRSLAAQLRPVITEHHLGGSPVAVLYESPGSSTQLTSIVTPRENQALAAARLAALGAIGGSEESAIADAREIGSDATGQPPRRHVVAAAERDEALRSIADLMEAVDLIIECITPVDAAAMTRIIPTAMAHRGATRGWLHVGLEQSWLVVVGEGDLRLFRPIRFGLDHLTEVLTRPICLNGARADFSLSPQRARKLLEEHGIPAREAVLDAESGLCGKHLMPLLAPVLQRVIVELKQSLRFGLTESQRSELSFTLCGHGAAVSGLATVIGEAIEIAVETQDVEAVSESSVALLPAPLDASACLRLVASCPNLLPAQTIVIHMARRFNRSIWAGLAAGLTLIAADAVRLDDQIANEHHRLAEVSDRIDDAQTALHESQQATTRFAAWQRFRNTCVAATEFTPDYSAVLREVALATPAAVRLTRLESTNAAIESVIGRTQQPPTLTIEAYAIGAEADTHIASFVESLRGSALVESVALGSTARSELDGQSARRFEVLVKLRCVGADGESLVAASMEVEP